MATVEEGRVCIKVFGRDAGSKAVITKVVNDSFVMVVTKVRPKPRRCNVKHLELLDEKVDINNKEQIAKAIEIDPAKLKL